MLMIQTKGRALTARDFECDLPAPGSSDVRYSKKFLQAIRRLIASMKPGFAPWIEDPDPPDRLSDAEIEKLAAGARRLLRRTLTVEELLHRALDRS
jgi:hypothetical protein